MLRSMTGYGEGEISHDGKVCSVSMRSVNSRYLKVQTKVPERFAGLESEVEKFLRELIRRGTVNVTVWLSLANEVGACRVNRPALAGILEQIQGLCPIDGALLGQLLNLPGMVEEVGSRQDIAEAWRHVKPVLAKAVDQLDRMRRDEGEAIQRQLTSICQSIDESVTVIERLTPALLTGYRDRLQTRVRGLLGDLGVTVQASDLVREVAIYVERSDIGEEIARLRSHLAQFAEAMTMEETPGRKLEFLAQEMQRESNTVASKANDVEIGRLAVILKNHVERVREVVQNVE